MTAVIQQKSAGETSSERPSYVVPHRTEWIPIAKLVKSAYQTRLFDDDVKIRELAEHIASEGLYARPQVRLHPKQEGMFEVISGHRRIRAMGQHLGWKEVPCDVFEHLTELQVYVRVGSENINRRNLSVFELVRYYQKGFKMFNLQLEELAKIHHRDWKKMRAYIGFAQTIDIARGISSDTDKLEQRLNAENELIVVLDEIKAEGTDAEFQRAIEMVVDDRPKEELQDWLAKIRANKPNATESSKSSSLTMAKQLLGVLDKITKTNDIREIRGQIKELRQSVVKVLKDSERFEIVREQILTKPQICPPHDIPAQLTWKLSGDKAQFIRKPLRGS
jgi:ParB/RepB/Spo0J family partition protein